MIAAVLMMAVAVTAASVAQLRRLSLRSLSFSALRRFSSAGVFSFGMGSHHLYAAPPSFFGSSSCVPLTSAAPSIM